MTIRTLGELVAFALEKAEDSADRQDLLNLQNDLVSNGLDLIDPSYDIVESWNTELVDEIICQTDDSLFEVMCEMDKLTILEDAYANHSKNNISMYDAIVQGIQNFSLELEADENELD